MDVVLVGESPQGRPVGIERDPSHDLVAQHHVICSGTCGSQPVQVEKLARYRAALGKSKFLVVVGPSPLPKERGPLDDRFPMTPCPLRFSPFGENHLPRLTPREDVLG